MTPGRWILLGLVVVAVLVAVVVTTRVPQPGPNDQIEGAGETPPAVVVVQLTVDSVDPGRGVMRVRIGLQPGSLAVPADGVAVFSNIGTVPVIRVRTDGIVPDTTAEIPLLTGDVVDYPFDKYTAQIVFGAVAGSETTLAEAQQKAALPVAVNGFVSTAGFDISASAVNEDDLARVDLGVERWRSTRVWVTAMMVLYWLLGASAIAVALAVSLSDRPWESRHLAWLGSMIFALAAFRTAAPGSPPIGTFFDYVSFFWAEGLVALALVEMIVFYMVVSRRRLAA